MLCPSIDVHPGCGSAVWKVASNGGDGVFVGVKGEKQDSRGENTLKSAIKRPSFPSLFEDEEKKDPSFSTLSAGSSQMGLAKVFSR